MKSSRHAQRRRPLLEAGKPFSTSQKRWFYLFSLVGGPVDAEYFQEKAATCLRLADELSLNHPARAQLISMAKDFQRRATELGAQPPEQHSALDSLMLQVTIICLLLAGIGATVIIQHPTWFGGAP